MKPYNNNTYNSALSTAAPSTRGYQSFASTTSPLRSSIGAGRTLVGPKPVPSKQLTTASASASFVTGAMAVSDAASPLSATSAPYTTVSSGRAPSRPAASSVATSFKTSPLATLPKSLAPLGSAAGSAVAATMASYPGATGYPGTAEYPGTAGQPAATHYPGATGVVAYSVAARSADSRSSPNAGSATAPRLEPAYTSGSRTGQVAGRSLGPYDPLLNSAVANIQLKNGLETSAPISILDANPMVTSLAKLPGHNVHAAVPMVYPISGPSNIIYDVYDIDQVPQQETWKPIAFYYRSAE
ncbi:hypothetical protein GNI_088920 [Gregarina niphandrodes]|uniref:Uncharacterized protein n=1 Tax=Gregarina niphandrodes TaxID=110365 RepID=A0A023B5L6_GRENI|nr:hypothetical protein GNI_088920 [Gregarina niphandrodes]EZG61392.1 hypothetical protein GNI_088920 [Gregarina niphandrodes]|eukprot:XP_011130752.1 hypothetical protein GNI_088920 [Gregarina niphandrodes]